MQCNPFHDPSPAFRLLYLFGSGGFGREVAWLAQQAWGEAVELRFVVNQPQYLRKEVNGIPVHLFGDLHPDQDARFLVALGNGDQRRKVASMFTQLGCQAATLVHPRAELSGWVRIGQGTVVCANCAVTCNVNLGEHVQINLGCSIGHDVTVDDFATLSPGVNVSGNVHIGREVFVGTNACFINGQDGTPLTIGDGAVIAAGACVTRPVPPGAMVAGVPAIRKR